MGSQVSAPKPALAAVSGLRLTHAVRLAGAQDAGGCGGQPGGRRRVWHLHPHAPGSVSQAAHHVGRPDGLTPACSARVHCSLPCLSRQQRRRGRGIAQGSSGRGRQNYKMLVVHHCLLAHVVESNWLLPSGAPSEIRVWALQARV